MRPRLNALVKALSLRASHYDRLGRVLTTDLGLDWPRLDAPDPESWVSDDVDRTYRQLRRLYGRANQSRYLAAAGAPSEAANEVKQSGELIQAATLTGFAAPAIDLKPSEESPTFLRLEPKQQVERIERSTLTAVDIRRLTGALLALPVQLAINAVITINAPADPPLPACGSAR